MAICSRRDNLDDVANIVVEFSPDTEQPGAIVWTRDDTISSQLATKDFNLGFEDANTSIATCSTGFDEEVCSDE